MIGREEAECLRKEMNPMKQYDYTTERYEATVPVEEYVEQCVDVPEFLEYCRQCDNYERLWSCPSFSFDAEAYWRKYKTFRIVGLKILFSPEVIGRTYTGEERQELINEVLWKEKRKLGQELLELEREIPGSISLSGGHCTECAPGSCTRLQAKPCRFPEQLRYSIEALGGNVGLTVTKYLKQKLLWIEEGKMPEYLMLICGILLP